LETAHEFHLSLQSLVETLFALTNI
jgi:hypothetical protein